MDNDDVTWLLFIVGGLFFTGLAISVFMTAVYATVACILGRFPLVPVALYGVFFGIHLAGYLLEWDVAIWSLVFISPVFIPLFWYYDRKNSRSVTFTQNSTSNEN